MEIVLTKEEKDEVTKIFDVLANSEEGLFNESESIHKDWNDTLDQMYGLLSRFCKRQGLGDLID